MSDIQDQTVQSVISPKIIQTKSHTLQPQSKYEDCGASLDFDLLDDIYNFDKDTVSNFEDDQQSSQVFDVQMARTHSQIDDYFENTNIQNKSEFKISTVKILDEIYDKYLMEVPDDLITALKLAEDTKIHLISELFAQRLLQIENELAENEDNFQLFEYFKNFKTHIMKQRSEVEKYINACLYDRLLSEIKFKYLQQIQPLIEAKLESFFKPIFQKNLFDNESQIHKKFSKDFVIKIQQEFNNISNEQIQAVIQNEFKDPTIKLNIPQFMMNHLLAKSLEYIEDLKNEFIKSFQTSFETQWNLFVQQHLDRDRIPDFDPENLQIFFNILIRLPITKEVKLDIVHLESKLTQFAFIHGMIINIDEFWTQQDEIEAYLISLHSKLEVLDIQSAKENFVNSLLYVVLHYFINDCYTASDRELLKQFFVAISEKINLVIMQNKNMNIWFYLAIFEREIAVLNDNTEYMLKDMAKSEFKSELRTLGIDEGIEKASILNLKKIGSLQQKSRHVVICISGFLTEDVEKSESWGLVVNHYKYAEVFALNWNSLSLTNFWNEGHYKEKGSKSKFMGKLFFFKAFKKQFRYALTQTQVAGTMLAIFLLKSEFSTDRAITLIGHSLGTVIILQALNVLHHFYKQGIARAARIIHDVFLWGGAAVLNPKNTNDEILQKSKICGIINGKLSNVYSLKDYILKYTFVGVMSDIEPIGLIPIFEDVPEVLKTNNLSQEQIKLTSLKKAYNYDCTIECPGHMTYSIGANLILEKIKNSF
eukprot:403375736